MFIGESKKYKGLYDKPHEERLQIYPEYREYFESKDKRQPKGKIKTILYLYIYIYYNIFKLTIQVLLFIVLPPAVMVFIIKLLWRQLGL